MGAPDITAWGRAMSGGNKKRKPEQEPKQISAPDVIDAEYTEVEGDEK